MEHLTKLIADWKEGKRYKGYKSSLKEFIIIALVTDYTEIEKVFLPVQIGKVLVHFTNFHLQSKGSGDDYYLVYINNKLSFYKIGWEPDCDGSYYYSHVADLLDILEYIEDFNISNRLDSLELCKWLIKLV